jgi:hypothetical protein
MTTPYRIAVLVGSLRKESLNRKLALALGAAPGVLFVTPEFNRSVPGALKDAIDIGSRPYGQSTWAGKPCAVISLSPGALGTFGANHIICASRSCSSTCPPWRSRKPTSATPATCSTTRVHSPTRRHASS